jgi:Flp pilus assembly pilin Flp
MKKVAQYLWKVRILADTRGQDLVEYALLAGFVAVAAGVFIPNVSQSMSTIYSKLASKLVEANG